MHTFLMRNQQKQLLASLLKNFAIFTRKHLCWSLLNFIKKRLQHKCFPVNIAKLLIRKFFFYRTPLVAGPESSSSPSTKILTSF